MTMTIGQLIDHCQLAYNSAVNDDFFPNQWFITMIWRAETELAIQGWVIERTYTTTSTSGTREIAWPTNALAIKEVKYDYVPLKKVTLKDDPKSDVTDPSGTPTAYAVWENTIIMYPTPNVTSDVILVRAFMAPDQLSATTDSLNVPDEYQIQLVDYVLGQMALKDQNLQLAQVYLQKWEQTVERCRQQRRRRLRADKSMRVRDTYFGTDGIGVFADGIWQV